MSFFIISSYLFSLWMTRIGMTTVSLQPPCPFYGLTLMAFRIVDVELFVVKSHILLLG